MEIKTKINLKNLTQRFTCPSDQPRVHILKAPILPLSLAKTPRRSPTLLIVVVRESPSKRQCASRGVSRVWTFRVTLSQTEFWCSSPMEDDHVFHISNPPKGQQQYAMLEAAPRRRLLLKVADTYCSLIGRERGTWVLVGPTGGKGLSHLDPVVVSEL